jgi:hypothetical protein
LPAEAGLLPARASRAAVATTSRLGRCTCQALSIRRSIDNARSDEGQCVRNPPDAAIGLEGFSGESSLISLQLLKIGTGPPQVGLATKSEVNHVRRRGGDALAPAT